MSIDQGVAGMDTDPQARIWAAIADLRREVAALRRPGVEGIQRKSVSDFTEVSTSSFTYVNTTAEPVEIYIPSTESLIFLSWEYSMRATGAGSAALGGVRFFNTTTSTSFIVGLTIQRVSATSYHVVRPYFEPDSSYGVTNEAPLESVVGITGYDEGAYEINLALRTEGASSVRMRNKFLWVAVL